ncbi:MAG: hypothetical protein Q4A30_01225 [Candidatus Saccharibacteria bacterium]|nr:hypothetical protein [Candidatus Saccharibacteria bacterium]
MDNMTYLYIGVIFGISILSYIVYFVRLRSKRSKLDQWLKDNPTAIKVYTATTTGIVSVGTITLHQVDNEPIQHDFTEGISTGVYLLPGKHLLEASFSSSRPGFFHRSVTTTYGPTKLEVEVAVGNTYKLSFNTKAKEFEFRALKSTDL